MGRLVIGSVLAGIVMFVLGFVFYVQLFYLGWSVAPESTQLAIQAALKALPHTGVYAIPMGETPSMVAAANAGPVAQVNYNSGGYPLFDPAMMIGGYIHLTVSVFLAGLLLWNLRDRVVTFGERARVLVAVVAIFDVYVHLAAPIWYRGDWRNALYVIVADAIVYLVGGLIVARWFLPRAIEAPATLAG